MFKPATRGILYISSLALALNHPASPLLADITFDPGPSDPPYLGDDPWNVTTLDLDDSAMTIDDGSVVSAE